MPVGIHTGDNPAYRFRPSFVAAPSTRARHVRRLAFATAACAGLSFAMLTAVSAQGAGERRGAPPGQFDFYVLALSWSPGFCELNASPDRYDQCRNGSKLGFVVHGLWPQYTQGFPTTCSATAVQPTRAAIATTTGLYPDEGLARYQWRKHGTCSGLSPTDYFAAVRRAREAVVIPPAITSMQSDATWTPLDLERAFVAANPGLRTDMMSVACRRGTLSEVRICFSKDLRSFQTCPQLDRRGCRGGSITVPQPQ
ncbi:MAG: ribonuclease T2 [Chelatococcus sp.]|nr:ribonuclease T2 [Chelatococcus sp. HY11]MBX3544188.1 ribonuclease T2 [Chelatococcus sp.]CAH1665148.1 Ribonuclease T2 [Hyphomicrobiales bacterium]CAH1681501.1 Ribonuclease T2 [Hyphomicrobiales bacterium]